MVAGTCHRQHRIVACPGDHSLGMEVDGTEHVGKTANGMDNMLQWTAAGGRITGSKSKEVFVAPDGVCSATEEQTEIARWLTHGPCAPV